MPHSTQNSIESATLGFHSKLGVNATIFGFNFHPFFALSSSEAETWSEDQTPVSYPAKSVLNPVIPSFQSGKSYPGNQITNSLN